MLRPDAVAHHLSCAWLSARARGAWEAGAPRARNLGLLERGEARRARRFLRPDDALALARAAEQQRLRGGRGSSRSCPCLEVAIDEMAREALDGARRDAS